MVEKNGESTPRSACSLAFAFGLSLLLSWRMCCASQIALVDAGLPVIQSRSSKRVWAASASALHASGTEIGVEGSQRRTTGKGHAVTFLAKVALLGSIGVFNSAGVVSLLLKMSDTDNEKAGGEAQDLWSGHGLLACSKLGNRSVCFLSLAVLSLLSSAKSTTVLGSRLKLNGVPR